MEIVKVRMMVQLSEEGFRQLSGPLLTHAHKNAIGHYFLCDAVDPNGPYFFMLVDMGNLNEDGPNLELSVPHSYIRFYMRAESEKQIGFLK